MVGSICYGIHRFLIGISEFYRTSAFRGFFGDFLALIVCIPIFATSQKFFGLRKKQKIYFAEVLSYSVMFSLYFEIIGPKYNTTFTRDFWDVVAYFLGALVLYLSTFITRFYRKGD